MVRKKSVLTAEKEGLIGQEKNSQWGIAVEIWAKKKKEGKVKVVSPKSNWSKFMNVFQSLSHLRRVNLFLKYSVNDFTDNSPLPTTSIIPHHFCH